MGEREYLITETELNKVFQFVISKPINEAIEAYSILLEVGKRADVDMAKAKMLREPEAEAEVESKDKK